MTLYFLLVLFLCNLSLVHLKQLPDVMTVDLSSSNYFKPINFTLQFTAYVDYNDPKRFVYESSAIPLLINDNDYSLDFDESRRSIKFASSLSTNYDIIPVNYTQEFEGKMGQETNSGTWNDKHQESFTFKIVGKQYFWGQSISERYNMWFIHELLPDGRIGHETDSMVADYYQVVFPFSSSGRIFFYGHNTNTKVWFIRELLPGGKMGKETDRGSWNTSYAVSFPFTIDGRNYFYGHETTDRRAWFIRNLLSNGKMGPLTDIGDVKEKYQVAFPFFINGRRFIFEYNTDDKKWLIKEFTRSGVFGKVTDFGVWKTRHQVSVPFKIDGKQYFYGQSILDGKHWFIKELLPNGQMGNETDRGVWNDNYQVVVPYNINGKQFLYFHCQETMRWVIRSLH